MSIRTRIRASGPAVRASDWRAERTRRRGRRDLPRRAADQIRSRVPVFRNRPNPVYGGQPHRADAAAGRKTDAGLASDLAGRRLADRARHPAVRTRDSGGRPLR